MVDVTEFYCISFQSSKVGGSTLVIRWPIEVKMDSYLLYEQLAQSSNFIATDLDCFTLPRWNYTPNQVLVFLVFIFTDDGRLLPKMTKKNNGLVVATVVAQLQPSFYNLELPRTLKYVANSTESLPNPAGHCCTVVDLAGAGAGFIVGSEDGTLHTFSFMQCHAAIAAKRRHIGPVVQMQVAYH